MHDEQTPADEQLLQFTIGQLMHVVPDSVKFVLQVHWPAEVGMKSPEH